MTMLLLTNPFAPQQPAPGAPIQIMTLKGIGPSAVAPTRSSASGSQNGSSTAYSGSGSGARKPASQHRAAAPLSSATPRSVITAQATSYPAEIPSQIAAEALGPQQKLLNVANEMPDPLPTSPFLKGAKTD